MIFRRIMLRNIKSYYGKHIIEFPNVRGKSIHLLGAPNGSGKTTLFDAVNACFFALPNDPKLRANDLSRGVDDQEMEVEVEFEHEGQTFRLNRRWVRRPGRPATGVDGVTLHSSLQNLNSTDGDITDDEDVSNFIDSLIPHHISHFFFFDGEQIQEYTDSSKKSIQDALERLLGLHHYIRLLADLEGIVYRQLREAVNSSDVGDELSAKLKARDSAENELRHIERRQRPAKRAAAESKRELAALEREEDQIVSALDPQLQSERQNLTETRDRLGVDIESVENTIKGLIPEGLALAWFWSEIQQATNKSLGSRETFNLEGVIDLLWEHREGIASALGETSPDPLRTALMSAVGVDELDAGFSLDTIEGAKQLMEKIRQAKIELWAAPDRLNNLKTEYERVNRELTVSSPLHESSETDVSELRQRLQEERRILSRREKQLADFAEREKQLNQAKGELDKAISALSAQDAEFQQINDQLDLCVKLQELLRNFIDDYRQTQINQLQDVFNRKFRELTNAPELIDRVTIDKETYDIEIIPRSGTNLTALEQSAGQKEVLAFTLISSVVELSNRQLPVMIDTPLARLDSVHRDNILTRFFPSVGPQVIILSTDTEIGREQRRQLHPYLASEHHLVRDPATARTTVEDGYLVE